MSAIGHMLATSSVFCERAQTFMRTCFVVQASGHHWCLWHNPVCRVPSVTDVCAGKIGLRMQILRQNRLTVRHEKWAVQTGRAGRSCTGSRSKHEQHIKQKIKSRNPGTDVWKTSAPQDKLVKGEKD